MIELIYHKIRNQIIIRIKINQIIMNSVRIWWNNLIVWLIILHNNQTRKCLQILKLKRRDKSYIDDIYLYLDWFINKFIFIRLLLNVLNTDLIEICLINMIVLISNHNIFRLDSIWNCIGLTK